MLKQTGWRWTACWLGFCLVGAVAARAVELGMRRVNVVQELGEPSSALGRGGNEVLTYKNGVRITLKDGRVTEMTGLEAIPAASATATAAVAAPTPAAAEPAEPPLTKEQAAELARQEKQWAQEEAKSRAAMEKTLADLEHSPSPPSPMAVHAFVALDFVIGLLVKWGLTVVALKLTFKYWGAEIFWRGLMLVALVDTVIRAAFGLVGQLVLKTPSMFYMDEAAAGIVMVFMLRKMSINQSFSQAVTITMTTKVFSIVVGSFLFVALLHLLH